MSRFFKLKMKTGGKKHDYKHLKGFGYQANVTEQEDEVKTDQELPPWKKVTESRFNEVKRCNYWS